MAPVARYAPPLALMALIFLLSAQPDLGAGLGPLGLVARKLVHMAEYGVLWVPWWRALAFRRPLLAAVITVAYAVTDEWHQTLVAGRNGSPVDVVIDAIGVAAAWAIARRRTAQRA